MGLFDKIFKKKDKEDKKVDSVKEPQVKVDSKKPEVKAKLESNDRKYSAAVRELFIKLDKTIFVSSLTLEDVRMLHIFSNDTYMDKDGFDIMWCEHIFDDND